MGVSRLFLSEIVKFCSLLKHSDFICESDNNKVIFLGDQSIRVTKDQIGRCRSFNLIKELISSKFIDQRKAILLDLFPQDLQRNITIRTIDVNGKPNLKLDITSKDEIKEALIRDSSISHFIDIGTLEHVIDPFMALKNISSMIMKEGLVTHLSPCQSYLNHGYYLISPQLLNDFYLDYGYKILRFRTISYFGNYDSIFSICFNLPYINEYERMGIRKLINKSYLTYALISFFRRILLRISKETYISFTARKTEIYDDSPRNTLSQSQYK